MNCTNTVMCYISQLRKKLEPDPRHPKYIHTIRGVGYKFEKLSGK
ncbi:helix-turn-helix domain-containing protein [[Ruminococcus] gnavus]|nr:helix-turn-helix domain-containing protein [Mediterraneibacter gnavus]